MADEEGSHRKGPDFGGIFKDPKGHKKEWLYIGLAAAGLLVSYLIYSEMKKGSSGSSSGSSTVYGALPASSTVATQDTGGGGVNATAAAQLQSEISALQHAKSTGTAPTKPTIVHSSSRSSRSSYVAPTYVAPTTEPSQPSYSGHSLASLSDLAPGTTIYGRTSTGQYIPEGSYSGHGTYITGLASGPTRQAEGIGLGLYTRNG
jgi:hypothetical protein